MLDSYELKVMMIVCRTYKEYEINMLTGKEKHEIKDKARNKIMSKLDPIYFLRNQINHVEVKNMSIDLWSSLF